MKQIFTIAFHFRMHEYYGIVRTRQRPEETEYHVTIMDSHLDQLLHGNNVIKLKDHPRQDAAVKNKVSELITIIQASIKGRITNNWYAA